MKNKKIVEKFFCFKRRKIVDLKNERGMINETHMLFKKTVKKLSKYISKIFTKEKFENHIHNILKHMENEVIS